MYSYVPQCHPKVYQYYLDLCTIDDGDRKLNTTWWQEDSIFNYNSLLISFFYGRGLDNCRDDLTIPKDVLLIGDSGGFQILTLGADIKPLDVSKWYEEIGVDIGFTLDIPTKTDDSEQIFSKKMETSNDNANIMAENQDDTKKLYLVVHGNTINKMERWYEDGKREHDWGGICVAKRNNSILTTANILLFAIEQEIENCHILKATSKDDFYLLYYFSDRFDLLTSDSSSYTVGCRFRKYNNPLSHTHGLYFGGNFTNNKDIKGLPCSCPVCSRVSVSDYNDGKYSGQLISTHNLWLQLDWLDKVNGIKDDKELLYRLMSPKARRAVDFMNNRLESGGSMLSNWV